MPFASIWNCTWTRGRPAGIGGMPRSLKRASERLSATSSRSPCSTWMSTAVWLSTPVVNISLPLAGIVELRRMIFDITPPIVSMPSDSGVTSSSSISRLPVTRMSACTAAPSATTSSGFSSLCGVRPNSSLDQAAHQRDARRPADQHDLVDLRRLEARVGERLAARPERALDDRPDERLELARACMRCRCRRHAGIVDVGSRLVALGQIPLRLDDGLADRLDRLRRGPAESATPSPSRPSTRSRQQQIDVVAAEVRVAVGRQHLEDAVLDAEDRDVERAAAEVVDRDRRRRAACRGRRRATPRSAR